MLRYSEHLDSFQRPPLEPGPGDAWVRLDKNEAPFSALGDVPDLQERLRRVDARPYPDPYPLYRRLADFCGVSIDRLLVTFGSEQAIRFAFEVMVRSGDEVLYPDPSFAMIEVFARQSGAAAVTVPFDPSLRLPMEALLDRVTERTRLILLPNPNNPTGSVFGEADLDRLAASAERVGALLVSDEAYYHYCDVTALGLLPRRPNLMVTRTFSKAWGLAGIRAGYAVASPEVIRLLRKVKPIDEISSFSLAACLAVLENPAGLEKNVRHVRRWKERFSQIRSPRLAFIPAEGNFVLFRAQADVEEAVAAWFERNRILVKHHVDHPALKGLIRFSIGSDAVMERVFVALKDWT
jgi:histidinol-phosphate aminotransferase